MIRRHCLGLVPIIRLTAVCIIAMTALSMSSTLNASAAGLPFYSVTFAQNVNSLDSVVASQTANSPTNLTMFAALTPTFSNASKSFLDWNTAPDGTGLTFVDGGTYNFTSKITLFAIWVNPYRTVTFGQNASSGDLVFTSQTNNVSAPLTLFSNLVPSFAIPGKSFANWNTAADGSGVSLADGYLYDFSSKVTLFAIWRWNPVAIAQFASNGGSGNVAAVSSHVGLTASLPSSAGFLNPGHTFVGWNTAADGSGIQYVAGAPYIFDGSQTLYAQWIPDVYHVTLLSGGGIGTPASLDYTFGTPAIVLPTPTLTGSLFTGWFNSQTGGVLIGLGGAMYTPPASITLYAQWSAAAIVVTYSPNGGVVSPSTSNYLPGSSQIILPTPTLTGQTFAGWFTALTGGSLVGLGGASFTPVASLVLFAQWSQVLTDTLTFDANGGSGSVPSISGAHGSSITLPGQSGLLRSGYLLARWNTDAKGTGTSYLAGQTLTLSGSSTLYAQWTGQSPARLLGVVGLFKQNSASLSPALKNQVRHLASTIRAMKYHKVTLYGYTSATGLASLNISLSRARASRVASYLRGRLTALHVAGVSVKWAGEGAIGQRTSASYSRVEVFVL